LLTKKAEIYFLFLKKTVAFFEKYATMIKQPCITNLYGGTSQWLTKLLTLAFPAALASPNALLKQSKRVPTSMKLTLTLASSAVLARVHAPLALPRLSNHLPVQ